MISVQLRITNAGGLRTIAFDNPRKKNAISQATYMHLTNAINSAALDDSVQVLALTGCGQFFSSGNEMVDLEKVDDLHQFFDHMIVLIRNLTHAFVRFPKLFVAVVNGPCFGIGATLIALCDVIYATDTAFFYTPFTALGISAEGCSTYTFANILGTSKASEILPSTNHRLGAAEALRLGFVSELFTVAELETKLWPRIRELAELNGGSVMATKRASHMRQRDLLGSCEQELFVLRRLMTSEESLNAKKKFIKKKSQL